MISQSIEIHKEYTPSPTAPASTHTNPQSRYYGGTKASCWTDSTASRIDKVSVQLIDQEDYSKAVDMFLKKNITVGQKCYVRYAEKGQPVSKVFVSIVPKQCAVMVTFKEGKRINCIEVWDPLNDFFHLVSPEDIFKLNVITAGAN